MGCVVVRARRRIRLGTGGASVHSRMGRCTWRSSTRGGRGRRRGRTSRGGSCGIALAADEAIGFEVIGVFAGQVVGDVEEAHGWVVDGALDIGIAVMAAAWWCEGFIAGAFGHGAVEGEVVIFWVVQAAWWDWDKRDGDEVPAFDIAFDLFGAESVGGLADEGGV